MQFLPFRGMTPITAYPADVSERAVYITARVWTGWTRPGREGSGMEGFSAVLKG